ncbi:hypothetical protein WJX73_005108 [Symbiochloris irregularis]|uniref:Uncharacterized protein n=1 Tax=Symbiochloris irregularis TaxID=706552 RepID=A0AAW1P9T2_9CHLO
MSGTRKLPEVETYLGFAAIQRQQLCQQILSAIDAIKLPNKKKFAPQDVSNVLEDLKASLFKSVQQVMEKDAQATAGLLTNALTSREEADDGHIFSNRAPYSAEVQKGHVSSAAAKDIPSNLSSLTSFKNHVSS